MLADFLLRIPTQETNTEHTQKKTNLLACRACSNTHNVLHLPLTVNKGRPELILVEAKLK